MKIFIGSADVDGIARGAAVARGDTRERPYRAASRIIFWLIEGTIALGSFVRVLRYFERSNFVKWAQLRGETFFIRFASSCWECSLMNLSNPYV